MLRLRDGPRTGLAREDEESGDGHHGRARLESIIQLARKSRRAHQQACALTHAGGGLDAALINARPIDAWPVAISAA